MSTQIDHFATPQGMAAICAMRPKTGKRTLPIATADIAVVGKASHPR
jgi:hypothetical protein